MYTFKKEERLCSEKLLEQLFDSGSSFILYPYKITWLPYNIPSKYPVQVIISVPKRRYKRAVDRNLLKRRIREAYRLYKHEDLYSKLGDKQLLLAISYIGKEVEGFDFIAKKMRLALDKLVYACTEHTME
ncbi:ribonuclease P protein component [Pedobacter sp. BS3]|uniref:ribonuclease P protein component n=1 Tax=Pedobacter sp. BS3 TaxID=2567937 RepID=UPI0016594A41|nr:ribonuclease P protein component [Pedobacter sp. BS3]